MAYINEALSGNSEVQLEGGDHTPGDTSELTNDKAAKDGSSNNSEDSDDDKSSENEKEDEWVYENKQTEDSDLES